MINLEINFFDLIKKLIFICICFYSNSVLSEETNFVEIIEKYWNETKTISGQFHQVLENDKIASGNFYIEKPYKSNFTYDDKLENIITTKFFIKDILALKNKIEHFKYLGYSLDSSIILREYEDTRKSDNTIYTFATNYLDEILKSRNFLINTISNLGILAIEKNNYLKNMIIKSATGK